jgi:mono/diheme cytochrome c family protein
MSERCLLIRHTDELKSNCPWLQGPKNGSFFAPAYFMQLQKSVYFLVAILCLTACGAGMPMSVPGLNDQSNLNLSSSSAINLSDATAVQNQAIQILANNCTVCHTATAGPANVFNLTDAAHLIQSGLVIPGSPDSSPLLQAVEANRMPKTGALGAPDKQILRTWILGGAKPPSVMPTVPVPPPVSPLPPTPVSGTLEEKAITILQTNCYSCHGAASNGGLTRITEPNFIVTLKSASGNYFLVPNDPTTSQLYDAIYKGRMPLGGAPLGAADVKIIADWITAGAKAPAAGTVPPPPALPPLKATFASLNANIFLPKCAVCHSGAKPSAGVKLDNYTNIRAKRNAAINEIVAGAMPKGGPKLSTAEIRAIQDWVAAGALNN